MPQKIQLSPEQLSSMGQQGDMYVKFVPPCFSEKSELDKLINMYINKTGDFSSFIESATAYNLSHLGVRSGVNLVVGKTDEKKFGSYDASTNSLFLNQSTISYDKLPFVFSVLSHESRHKAQSEKQSYKCFSEHERESFSGVSDNISRILGVEKSFIYRNLKNEEDSFMYGFDSANAFLLETLKRAQETGNSNLINRIKSDIQENENLKNAKIKAIELGELSFKEQIGSYYDKATTTHNALFSALKAFMKEDTSQEEAKKGIEIANRVSANGKPNLYSALFASTVLLSYFPKREFIEEYLDFTLSKPYMEMKSISLAMILSKRVPMIESDLGQYFLQYSFDRILRDNMMIENMTKIDERVLARTLSYSFGKEDAEKVYEFMAKNPNLANRVDLRVFQDELSNCRQMHLFSTPNGAVYGCNEALNVAVNNYCVKMNIPINSKEFFDQRAEIGKRLSRTINEFGYPLQQNDEFSKLIYNFVVNPYDEKFSFKAKDFTEKPIAFTDNSAQLVEKYISSVRNQEKGEDVSRDDYDKTYGELIQTLKEVSDKNRETTEILRGLDIKLIARTLAGFFNSNKLEKNEDKNELDDDLSKEVQSTTQKDDESDEENTDRIEKEFKNEEKSQGKDDGNVHDEHNLKNQSIYNGDNLIFETHFEDNPEQNAQYIIPESFTKGFEIKQDNKILESPSEPTQEQ